MAKQVVNLGTPPGGTDGDTTRVGFEKVNSNFTELYSGIDGLILGLVLEWVSGTSLRVTNGIAHIPSSGYVVNSPAAITKASLSLTASTWYHVYLFINAGAPDIEIVTTAPASPYSGTARVKTGDTSRRYLGSIRTSSGGGIMRFMHLASSGEMKWSERPAVAPLRILSNGVATASTNVSTSGCSPITATAIVARFVSTIPASETIRVAFVGSPVDGAVVSPSDYTISIENTKEIYTSLQVVAGTIKYMINSAPTSGGIYIDVIGYFYGR